MPHSQPTALQQTVCNIHLDPQYHIFHWGSTILGDSTLCHNWIALQILEMTQSSTFIKHWIFPLSRTWNTKRWPPNYDVMIWWRSPRHAPHIWGQCVFDLPYACMCIYPPGSKLSGSNVIRSGEVRWSHNVQFCLKSKVSLEHRGRSHSPVSARNAADDEDLQLGYVVRNVAIEFSPSRAVTSI